MIEFSVKPPIIPIPFHKLLRVVALVDNQDPQTLLDHIAAEHFQIEIGDNFQRGCVGGLRRRRLHRGRRRRAPRPGTMFRRETRL